MFYLKKNGTEISFDESEVYTRCPNCGKEFEVDIFFELLADDDEFCPFSTSMYCQECGKQLRKERTGQ